MIYKSKARYEGATVSGVTRINNATETTIYTGLGPFYKRGKDWVWSEKTEVKLFPIEKESKP